MAEFVLLCFAVLTYRDKMLGKKIEDIHLQHPILHTAANLMDIDGNGSHTYFYGKLQDLGLLVRTAPAPTNRANFTPACSALQNDEQVVRKQFLLESFAQGICMKRLL